MLLEKTSLFPLACFVFPVVFSLLGDSQKTIGKTMIKYPSIFENWNVQTDNKKTSIQLIRTCTNGFSCCERFLHLTWKFGFDLQNLVCQLTKDALEHSNH